MSTVTCPRCSRSHDQEFYGPCSDCLNNLRRVYSTENNYMRQQEAAEAAAERTRQEQQQ